MKLFFFSNNEIALSNKIFLHLKSTLKSFDSSQAVRRAHAIRENKETCS